jgi:hypothetical protein
MGEVPEYRMVGDHMHVMWRELEVVIPVSVMLAGMADARHIIDEWQHGSSARILEFTRDAG